MGYEGPHILSAYMKKKKEKVGLFSGFNKRWFVLDFDQGILSYGPGRNKKATCVIPFKDILKIEGEPSKDQLRLTTSSKALELLHSQIKIYTVRRLYQLHTLDNNTKAKWVNALKFITNSRSKNTEKRTRSCLRTRLQDQQSSSEMDDSTYKSKPDDDNDTKMRFTSTGRVENLIQSPLGNRANNLDFYSGNIMKSTKTPGKLKVQILILCILK